MKTYTYELDAQEDFYNQYLPLIDNTLTMDDVQSNNNDGQIGDVLLEFKLQINDLNRVVFQAVKYLSAMRIKGFPVPSSFWLLSMNDGKAYKYTSQDYFDEIEMLYFGGASANNQGFVSKAPDVKLDFRTDDVDRQKLIWDLKEARKRQVNNASIWMPVNIDDNNIVGWAEQYYSLKKNATKASFIGEGVRAVGEIRKPDIFKGMIIPYVGETNRRFEYIMDRLNDNFQKKDLGAFFTPSVYAKKSHELVYDAIRKHQRSGNSDYIILDRCAGTGNLEYLLNEDVPDDIIDKDILSHVLVNTYEYYEYKVLLERLGDKVRSIIPPIEKPETFHNGVVRGSDALSEEFVNNPVIKQFLNDDNCTIILFENPPYAETTSAEHQRLKVKPVTDGWKSSYVVSQMRKEVKGPALNDLGNIFVWSAFKYYIRKPEDSYIVYSPLKYWKAQHLINKEFLKGYGFNRKHFHTTTNAFVSCIHWGAKDSDIDSFSLRGFDLDKEGQLVDVGDVAVNRIYEKYSDKYYDKRKFPCDSEDGIWTGLNGYEASDSVLKRIKPIHNENIVGYLVGHSMGFDNPDMKSSLLVAGRYDGNGFFLRDDNFKEKLPMFAATRYIRYDATWTERARVMKSADGFERYDEDLKANDPDINTWLNRVLFYTCLEKQNHMVSFKGSDGRDYRNPLCLDNTHGDTLALKTLKINQQDGFALNDLEQELFNLWRQILDLAKKTKNYNSDYVYGVYQIDHELNTKTKDERTKKNIADYPELNGHLSSMRKLVKEYYIKHIVDNLFKYEFIK